MLILTVGHLRWLWLLLRHYPGSLAQSMLEQGGLARWYSAALLGWCSPSVCCLYSYVVGVGGISVVLCCCHDFPSPPVQLNSVFADRVSFFLCACQVCLVGPACKVPSWWVFRPGSRHSIGELNPANPSSNWRDFLPRPTLARVPRDASKY